MGHSQGKSHLQLTRSARDAAGRGCLPFALQRWGGHGDAWLVPLQPSRGGATVDFEFSN